MSTELFKAMKEAEAAFNADEMSVEKLAHLEAAERAYFAALAQVRAKWEAMPEGARKDSAEVNAHDTVIEQGADHADELYRLEMAVSTFELFAD